VQEKIRIPFSGFLFLLYKKESKNRETLGNIKGEFLQGILYDKGKIKK